MTNKERAKHLTRPHMPSRDYGKEIEQALDEAEQRGKKTKFAITCQKYIDRGVVIGLNKALEFLKSTPFVDVDHYHEVVKALYKIETDIQDKIEELNNGTS